jgi:uncharacterized membrane protein YkvA (DUF1232 family)
MTDGERIEQEEEEMEAVDTSLSTRVRDTGFWKELWYQIRLVWYLVRDPEVPFYVKAIPLAALIYVLIPTDFIPDVFPVMGQLDDITALLVGGKVFIEMSPPHVVRKYLTLLRQHRSDDSVQAGSDELSPDEGTDILGETIVIEGDFVTIEEETEAAGEVIEQADIDDSESEEE